MVLALAKKLVLLRGKVQGTDSLLIMRDHHVRNKPSAVTWSTPVIYPYLPGHV